MVIGRFCDLGITEQRGFPLGSVVKNLAAMQETQVQSLGQEDSLEEDMVTHFSVIAWRIPWTEEHGRLQPIGLQRVRQLDGHACKHVLSKSIGTVFL